MVFFNKTLPDCDIAIACIHMFIGIINLIPARKFDTVIDLGLMFRFKLGCCLEFYFEF